MSNDESLKNGEARMTNGGNPPGGCHSSLDIRHLLVILPLAQIEKWREMGRDFQSDHSKLAPGLIVTSLFVLATVVVFLWGLARLMNRQEGRRLFNSPKQLFRSLCRAHELDRVDRRLLTQIGRSRQILQLASLFLEPDQFAAAVEDPAFEGQRLAIRKLRDRLFGPLP